MENYPKPVTKETHKKISEYLDNSIYQIKGNEDKYGIGFFCSLKCHDKYIYVLITNYHIINENYLKNYNYIDVLINQKLIRIRINSIYYLDKQLDLSVIEIKENEEVKILELDENIYKEESEIYLNKESIYIINDNNVSYSIINNISKSEFIFHCNINNNSYCYPIFNLTTNKLIGIYKKNFNCFHKGIFFKYIIMKLEYIIFNNEINILINIDDTDINNKIYFLDNEYIENDIKRSSHNNLKELNELNTELYIKKENKEKKEKYKKYFIPEEKGIYNIKLKFNINLTDCSYMFAGCEKIINMDLIKFNTKYVKNMRYMFYGCQNLKSINLYSFNTINCMDISHMFEECKNLEYLDLSSFRINNIKYMNNMFVNCFKLNEQFPKKINFKLLQELYLNSYEILDIKFIGREYFKQLQQLNLSDNKISDIKVLERVDFKQLQQLDLGSNQISDIKVLERVDFKQLQQLDLSDNKKSDIKVLERVDFKQLQQLNLSLNQISDKENSSTINYLNSKISNFHY